MRSPFSTFQKGGRHLRLVLVSTAFVAFCNVESHAGVTSRDLPNHDKIEVYSPKEKDKESITSEPSWVNFIPAKKVIEWRRHIHQKSRGIL